MATIQDKDIALWVCPHGYPPDVIEFSAGGPEPNAKVCGQHGQPFYKRCPNEECPSPIYHPSDFEQKFHKPCGARIPWAERRRAEAEVDFEPFQSRLVGTGSYMGKSSTPFPPSRELTPEERQDLIVPPSERLPAESVRTPVTRETKPPRVTPLRGAVPDNSEGITGGQQGGMRRLRDDPESTKLARAQQPAAATPTQVTKRWWHGLSAMGKWLVGVLGAIIAGTAVLLIRSWLISQGIVRP